MEREGKVEEERKRSKERQKQKRDRLGSLRGASLEDNRGWKPLLNGTNSQIVRVCVFMCLQLCVCTAWPQLWNSWENILAT